MGDGTIADLTSYPFASAHEDFVALVENTANDLGWAAALRPDKRDIFLSLKNPRDYPITMMWFSNGGRDYAPWNGRHRGVLGPRARSRPHPRLPRRLDQLHQASPAP